MTRFSWRPAFLGLAAWVFTFLLALKLGAIKDASPEIISQLRLPRAILAGAVGAGLSVSGAVLQALFSNPLCEPYTLGISSGAALGAVIGLALGIPLIFGGVASSAFAGAVLFMAVLFLVSRKSSASNLVLLMTGVMLGFLGSALVSLWMALSDPAGIQGSLLWILGDFSRARLQGSLLTLAGVALLLFMTWRHSRALDGFLMGEEGALSLGVDVPKERTRLVLLTSLLIALCVSASGMIGFVGLVVPHFVRRVVGSLHLKLLPLCALWGAVLMTVADLGARFLFQPYELPVGVITALTGAPLFLIILLQNRRAQ